MTEWLGESGSATTTSTEADTAPSGGSESSFDMSSALGSLSSDLFGGDGDGGNTAGEGGRGDTSGGGQSDDAGVPSPDASTPAEGAAHEPGKEGSAESDPAATAERSVPAPETWSREAKEHWNTIPDRVKQEILKREGDIFRGIEQYKEAANFGNQLADEIKSYGPTLRAQGLAPIEHVKGLMNFHYVLSTGTPEAKADILRQALSFYKIDPASLVDGATYEDPAVAGLKKEISTLKSGFDAVRSAEQARVLDNIRNEIAVFSSDKTAHPYFDEVSKDMTALINGKVCKTLQEAYDHAVFSNPVTRQKEMDRIQAERKTQAEKESSEKAAAAKKATEANVRASSKSGRGTAEPGSIDDTLAETLRKIKSRG